jgi:hypothetical protein
MRAHRPAGQACGNRGFIRRASREGEGSVKKNPSSKQYIGEATRRRDLLTPEREHDPYKARAKSAGPAICPQCGARFDAGRWFWREQSPPGAAHDICPAYHRIADHFPAGEIRIGGDFAVAHREEILNLVRKCQAREAAEHPMSRIMAISEAEDEVLITTTDIHLPRVIGNALERAYKEQAEFSYAPEEHFVRVKWARGRSADSR